jgi:hypothetical protein
MLAYSLEIVDINTMAGFEEMMTALALIMGLSLPVVFVVVRLAPVYAVISTEDVSVSEGFSRAFEMTSGNFGHICAGWILLTIVKAVLDFGLSFLAEPLIFGLGYSMGLAIYNIFGLLILIPLDFIFFAVLYMDLESRRRTVRQAQW